MRLKKILIPLDESQLAEQALNPILNRSKEMSVEIILLHVIVPTDIDLMLPEAWLSLAEEEAETYLAAVSTRFANNGVKLRTAVVVNFNVSTTIIDYAQDNDVDLIVMSRRGRSGSTRWRFGSVTARLLRQATCPVLVVPEQSRDKPLAFHHILVPLDGSALAATALDPAAILAQVMSAKLVLLRVVSLPYRALELATTSPHIEELEATACTKAVTYLNQIKPSLTETYGISIETAAIIGLAADVIVDYADDQDVDLIAMSSHGYSDTL